MKEILINPGNRSIPYFGAVPSGRVDDMILISELLGNRTPDPTVVGNIMLQVGSSDGLLLPPSLFYYNYYPIIAVNSVSGMLANIKYFDMEITHEADQRLDTMVFFHPAMIAYYKML